MTVPYTFATATTALPLSQLDTNFATPITLGNTAVYLGNTTSTIYNLALGNVSILSGSVILTNVTTTNATVTNLTSSNVAITGGTISNVALTLDAINGTPIGNVTPSTGVFTTVNSSTYVANATITGSLSAGAYSYGTLGYSDVNIYASYTSSANAYTQTILQNIGSGTASSADFIVSNNSGTASTYYGDLGITSSNYNTPGQNIINTANTVYLQSVSTPLAIGTLNSNALSFYTNSTLVGAFSAAGGFSTVNDASIHGLTVGLGGGSISNNTALGYNSLYSNTAGGGNNVAIGTNSAYNNTTGYDVVAVGSNSVYSNTIGNEIVGIGYKALYSNTTGAANIGIGSFALQANTTASNNTAIGYQALVSNTTASNNTAVGYQAGYTNTTGAYSTYIGYQAGYTASGTGNTCLGWFTGYGLTTGVGNTFIGGANPLNTYNAGYAVTSGSYNVIIGAYTGGGAPISATGSNYIVLSDGAGNTREVLDPNGNAYLNATSATNMTAGFYYIPSAAGAPSGTPTAITGHVPMYYDSTNNAFYIYNGAWKKVTLA